MITRDESGMSLCGVGLKGLLLALAIVILLCVCFIPVSAAVETVIYVSSAGNDSTGTGAEAAPYKTVNKAVAAAPANSAATIYVSGNVSCESTADIYNQKDITIKTADGDTATISAGASFPSGTPSSITYMFQLDPLSKLTFDGSGLTLKPDKNGVGFVKTGGDVIIRNGTFTGASITVKTANGAFCVSNGGTLTLAGGSITSNSIGNYYNGVILQQAGGKVAIKGGKITANTIGGSYYNGVLFLYGDKASAEMTGGEISNNKIVPTYSATVYAFGNGTSFTLGGGSVKDNTADKTGSTGGILLFAYKNGSTEATAKKQTLKMNGGEISGNTALCGAGVYLYGADPRTGSVDIYSRATFAMTAGVIKNNTANKVYGNTNSGFGGGVYVRGSSEFNMSGGEISGNKSYYYGGGVAVNDMFATQYGTIQYKDAAGTIGTQPAIAWETYFPAIFTMYDGKITGNTAYMTNANGGEGGGVFVMSNNVKIIAGTIAENTAERHGGGIYVTSEPYVLRLSNVVVRDNTADKQGGGVWSCQRGSAVIYLGESTGVFRNKATNEAGDDYVNVVPPDNTKLTTTVADSMLGGGLENWYQDGGVLKVEAQDYPHPDTSIPRYSAAAGVPIRNIVNSPDSYSLKSISTDEDQQKAQARATLDIYNNTAVYGGGIASNGSLIIGNSAEYTFNVQKKLTGVGNGSGKAFTFVLSSASPTGGVPLPEKTRVTVIGEGSASFGTVKFTKAGWYTYTIREQAGDDATVTYDSGVYTISIKTEDAGGNIVVTSVVISRSSGLPDTPSETVDEVVFVNDIALQPAKHSFPVNKKLTGEGDGSDKEFTFIIEGVNYLTPATTAPIPLMNEPETPSGIPMPEKTTVIITGAGTISFGEVSFQKAGTYTYTIKEVKGSDPLVTYDTAVYTVKVITEENDGRIVVTDTVITCLRDEVTTTKPSVEFTNNVNPPYTPPHTGDSQNPKLLIVLSLCGLLGMTSAICFGRRRYKQNRK